MTFETPISKSYKCDKLESLNIVGNKVNGTLGIRNVQLEAFRKSEKAFFHDGKWEVFL